MTKIFISHSSKDTEFAKQIAQALTEVGISVWIDISDIRFGENWSSEVQRGLDACDAMLVVISPDAMESKNVENEWQYFIDEGKPLFTIRWIPAKVHFQLRRLQYVDFHKLDFQTKFAEMCAKLQKQGFLTSAAQGEMHEINSDVMTPPPRPAVASPPRIQGAPQTQPPPIKVAPLPVVEQIEQILLPATEKILPPPFEWCEIPAGKVTLEAGLFEAGSFIKETTSFDVPAFAIAKYPITNAQFKVFVNHENGYANPEWWDFSNAAREWRLQNSHPYETAFRGRLLPRTYVSWFEAVGYCYWISASSNGNLSITLPTRRQWQRAAVGDTGWTYPWGDQFDRDKCNTRESSLEGPTPVTKYPQGASPYGVMDMFGNVLEWVWSSDARSNNLCGASWQDFIRGGKGIPFARRSYYQGVRVNHVGFRLCLSTSSS